VSGADHRPMNLGIVVTHLGPQGGGAERSTAQIARQLVDRGHRVTMVTGFCPQAGEIPGTSIVRFADRVPKTSIQILRFARWAKKQLAEGEFDASLSVTTATPASVVQPRGGTVRETLERNIAMRASWWGRMTKRLLIQLTAKQQVLLALERKTLADPAVKGYAAVSGYVAKQLAGHYEVDPSRVRVIPNGSEMPVVTAAQRLQWRRRLRQAFDIPEDAVVMLFAALNPRLKGVDPLLHATGRVLESGEEMVLLLAGDVGYAQQHLAATLGVRAQVRFVGMTSQMQQLYCASDVTVLPTYYDPSSKVVIESLMMGVPAISTRFNGASDFIRGDEGEAGDSDRGLPGFRGLRGRVVDDPADVDALAQAMIQLCDRDARQACIVATEGLSDALSMRRHVDQLEAMLIDVAKK